MAVTAHVTAERRTSQNWWSLRPWVWELVPADMTRAALSTGWHKSYHIRCTTRTCTITTSRFSRWGISSFLRVLFPCRPAFYMTTTSDSHSGDIGRRYNQNCECNGFPSLVCFFLCFLLFHFQLPYFFLLTSFLTFFSRFFVVCLLFLCFFCFLFRPSLNLSGSFSCSSWKVIKNANEKRTSNTKILIIDNNDTYIF